MKILFVKKLYSPIGGSETLTYQWARRLAERGHEVRVLSLWPLRRRHQFPPSNTRVAGQQHYRSFVDGGVEVFQLAPRGGPIGKVLDIFPFMSLIRRDLALRLAGDCDIVHNICREYTSVALALQHARRVPLVLTPLPHPGQPFSGNGKGDWALYREVDGIAAMTVHEKAWYEARGIAAKRVLAAGAGPSVREDGDGAAFRARHHIDGPMVLFVGRQEGYKGFLALAAASRAVWASHPKATFVFIGEKAFLSRFRDPLARYRDTRIVDLMVTGEQEKADAYAACDVFCMPSAHETLGLTYLEAWSYGKPVIGGDIPPLREVIDHGTDGLLVAQQPLAIASALGRLLADPHLARRMGEAGRRKVAHTYAWPRVIDRLEAFYQSLSYAKAPGDR